MDSLLGTRRACSRGRVCTTLLSAILLSSAGYLDSLAWAQTCKSTKAAPIRVDNSTVLGTLRAAVNCTDGGLVKVIWAGAVTLDLPIAIANGIFLHVTGEDGLAEVRGDDSKINGNRLFDVSPGGGLTLTRLKLSGGTAAEGGAIYSSSAALTLNNCTFENNSATDGSGGAVCANGGNITIMGGEFLGNKALKYGGAVHVTDGRLKVQGGSRFDGNEALIGGALYCGPTTVGSGISPVLCSLMQTVFTSNRAAKTARDGEKGETSSGGTLAEGGAIYVSSATLTLDNCTFQTNDADGSGGAVWANDGNVTITDGEFVGNTAVQYGGAVHASDSRLEVNGRSRFKDNEASIGGGLFCGPTEVESATSQVSCSFIQTEFASNRATYADPAGEERESSLAGTTADGGAIYSSSATLTLDNCTFQTNDADGSGGAVWANGGNITITGGEFVGNNAIQYGGAVHASDSRLEVNGRSRFKDNEASIGGGLFCVSTAVESAISQVLCSFNETEFTSNRATYVEPAGEESEPFSRATAADGGGIYVSSAPLTLNNCTFEINDADGSGGAVLVNGGTITIMGGEFVGNNASQYGGAVHASDSRLEVKRLSKFDGNEASIGGALFCGSTTVESTTSQVLCSLVQTEFTSNRATYADADGEESESSSAVTAADGGAIYVSSATLTLDNCIFESNDADGSGGAVLVNGGNITIMGGDFLRNRAIQYGGAMHANDSRLEVQGESRFDANEASIGGALFCGSTTVESATSPNFCLLVQTEFTSNRATYANPDDEEDRPADIYGGGAAAFFFADANITDSVFSGNYGHRSGGALFGGPSTNISVNRCKFGNNTSSRYGGAISASSIKLAGHTQLTDNSVVTSGGAVHGWDPTGTIVFNDVFCKSNSALVNGGCFQGWGKAIFNDGTVMLDNHAPHGGSIYADAGSTINVNGGNFTSRTSDRGGFLYAAENTTVTITGGLFADNIASRKGAALYCSGNGVSTISIEGGTFRNNSALEAGGAVAAWGEDVLVTITGGTFEHNTALLFGGFVFIEVQARISCERATIRGNSAGEQGGGIYAQQAHVVYSSCDLIANESPQGAAIYLTNVKNATFEDHNVADNLASGGSVVYMAASTVVAKGVTLESSVGLPAYSSNRAVQLDEHSTLDAEKCVFDGWLGDTVVLNLNSARGSLVLNSCDFSGSSAAMAVISPNSDAEIRNAVVSNVTLKNAVDGTVENPLTLVDRALDCSDSNVCGVGECVDSLLGVLCECLEGGECQSDGGELSLSVKTRPENKTFSPNAVSFELLVSSGFTGMTFVIWDLVFEGCDLELDVVPPSGVLPSGSNATVTVTGTSTKLDVGGDLHCSFYLKPVGNSSSSSTNDVNLEVISTFYLYQAYEFAQPQQGDGVNGFSCDQCATINGEEGVDCESPGATLASLPIRPRYWRSNNASLVVRECLYLDACSGATNIESADDYCADGYIGPYCAVCADGYGSGASNSCHNCDDTKAHLLLAMSALFCLVVLLIMFLAVVFLIGGLDAVDVVRKSFVRTLSLGSSAPGANPSVPKAGLRGRSKSLDAIVSPVHSFTPEAKREVGSDSGGGRGTFSRSSSRVFPAKCSDADDTEWGFARPLDSDGSVRAAAEISDETGRHLSRNVGMSAGQQAPLSAVTGSRVDGAYANTIVEAAVGRGGQSNNHGFGHAVKRCVSRLPLDKLKILVAVWQILTAFSSITGVEFPASYSRFLSWISFVNLDIGSIFAVSCVLPSVNFYASLLVATLAPLGLAAVLVLTYHIAKHRAGIGSFGVVARRAAWSRHVAAGLLLTFLVFTSASTAAFKTFACDNEVVEGDSYLRADYSVSCGTRLHTIFQVYAGAMILVYPIGIPVLYAVILWENRELLNPRIRTKPDGADETDTPASPAREDDIPSAASSTSAKGQAKNSYSVKELQELEKKVKARRVNPQLVPSMFLWKDFGPDLYYYEVVECGRRILLTGLLTFIAPHTATQAAMACLFAFACLLGFELLRPHMDPADSWLYRLGCVIIFLSNFLALLIKVDAGEESNHAAFGVLMVAVNVLLVVAVLVTSWFAVQQSVDDSREEERSFALA